MIALPSAVPLYFSLEFLKVEGMETVRHGVIFTFVIRWGGYGALQSSP